MRKSLVFLLAMFLLLTLAACGQEAAPAPAPEEPVPTEEVDDEPVSTFEISSIEDFYPELHDVICGVELPKPDGTRRLIGVKMLPCVVGKNIPVLTEIQYGEDGVPTLQLLSFGSGGYHDDNEEYDEQDRLIREDESDYGYIVEFSYAEHGCSYTSTYTSVSGTYTDKEFIRLKDSLVSDWVRVAPETEWKAVITYTEDGLPEQMKFTELETNYSYQAEQYEDGSLYILYAEDDSDWSPLIEFDEHGYLVKYFIPWSRSYPLFTYSYEDLP